MKFFDKYILIYLIYLIFLPILSQNLEARQLREVPDSIIECDINCIQVAYPYALVAQDIYDDNPTFDRDGWTRGLNPIIFDFQDNVVFFNDRTWTIQDDDGLHMGLYLNNDRAEVVLAIRGTEFNSLDDLLTDVQQIFGAIPEQYEHALVAAQELLPYIQQSGYSFTVAGHSLGGGIAQYIANSLNLPAITFNSAPISEDVENDSFARKYPDGIPENYPIPTIYNLVFRREGRLWSSYDIIADSYSSADSGGLLGLSFSLITEENVDLLELHSLDEMIEEMRRKINQ